MALDARIARRWRVGPAADSDHEDIVARVTVQLEAGPVVLCLSAEEAALVAKKLLTLAAHDVGMKVESAFKPLVDLANRINRIGG